MNLKVNEYHPPEKLARYVEKFWAGDFNLNGSSLYKQQVIPNGFVELIIHMSDDHCALPVRNNWHSSPDYTVIGLYTKPYEVRFNTVVKVFGIRFKPEGMYAIFRVPAGEFSECFNNMEHIAGREFREFCLRLRDAGSTNRRLVLASQYLFKNLNRTNGTYDYIHHAAELIRQKNGNIRMDDLKAKLYISPRQFEREFRKKLGITPMMYTRIRRFNEVQRLLQLRLPVNFAQLTYDCGYADQAHFIRDFKHFTGINPTLFLKGRNEYIVNT